MQFLIHKRNDVKRNRYFYINACFIKMFFRKAARAFPLIALGVFAAAGLAGCASVEPRQTQEPVKARSEAEFKAEIAKAQAETQLAQSQAAKAEAEVKLARSQAAKAEAELAQSRYEAAKAALLKQAQDRSATTNEDGLPALALLRPTTHTQTLALGGEYFSRYATASRKASKTRRNINLGTWFAATYVAGSAGLKAHPNNILVGSLVGTALPQLEPILSPGGPEASNASMAQVACVMKEVSYFVDGVKDQPEYWKTEDYMQVNDYAVNTYLVIYEKNQRSRTPALVTYEGLSTAMKKATSPENSSKDKPEQPVPDNGSVNDAPKPQENKDEGGTRGGWLKDGTSPPPPPPPVAPPSADESSKVQEALRKAFVKRVEECPKIGA